MNPSESPQADSTKDESNRARWHSTRERSTPFMLRLLLRCALLLGRRGLRPIVYCTVAYFILTSGQGRRASRDYLRRVLDREPTLLDVWRHFLAFATCSTDRFFMLSGRSDSLRVVMHRTQEALEVSNRGKGCLLVMAHVGSFEIVRLMGKERKLPIAVLLDRNIGKMLTQVLEQLNPGFAANVIDASRRGPELVLTLKEMLESGRMIGLMADRTREEDRTVRVNFLGGQAAFPVGPWTLAGALDVPVIIGFGLYRGGNRYDAYMEVLSERITMTRSNREQVLRERVQAYAVRLEHYLRLAPYNWFNYFDFWQ